MSSTLIFLIVEFFLWFGFIIYTSELQKNKKRIITMFESAIYGYLLGLLISSTCLTIMIYSCC